MRVLIALDLNDEDLTEAYGLSPADGLGGGNEWDDMIASLDARLDEAYFGPNDHPVRGKINAICDVSGDALSDLIDAAEFGAEGIDDAARRGHIYGSLLTFRQHADA